MLAAFTISYPRLRGPVHDSGQVREMHDPCLSNASQDERYAGPLGRAAAQRVLNGGWAILRIPAAVAGQHAAVLAAAHDFFAQPDVAKAAACDPPTAEGYRPLGAEYSIAVERPDLNESFSVWMQNVDRAFPETAGAAADLQAALLDLAVPLMGIAQTLLSHLAARFAKPGEAPRPVDVTGATYLQVNRYRPAEADREFLQERHEDGHLITIHHCRQPGLEIEQSDGCYVPAPHGPDQVLVLAGELLTMMTGHRIPPVHHRVRRHADQGERLSVMLFVNPSLKGRLAPWVDLDVNAVAAGNPRRFGLPSLDLLLRDE